METLPGSLTSEAWCLRGARVAIASLWTLFTRGHPQTLTEDAEGFTLEVL